jgi:hypothetical protein
MRRGLKPLALSTSQVGSDASVHTFAVVAELPVSAASERGPRLTMGTT